MSDLDKPSSTTSVSVVELKIIGSNGQVYDLRDPIFFNNIQIYESIYSRVVSGSIQLIDGKGLFSLLGMQGNEYLYISFCRPGEKGQDERYTRTFRIYKSGLRKPIQNSQVQSYVLYFCSEELLFSNQLTISRSYKGLTNTSYVYNTLVNDLLANKKRVNGNNLENSAGVQDHVLTKYTPFDAIDYFTARSYNSNESPFVFFENRDGFNFLSLETLFAREAIQPPINYSSAKLTYEQAESPFKNANEVTSYEFEQSFNTLDGITNSAFCNKLFTLDLVRQKYTQYDYSAVNEFSSRYMMDGYYPLNDFRNRADKGLYEAFDGSRNYWLTNLNQNDTPYAISKRFRINNTNIEKYLMQRQVHMNLLKNTRVSCTMPGNPNYSAGYMVEFNLPAFAPTMGERALDPYHRGKYLITHVRHSITPDSLTTVLLLSKNSVNIPYDPASNSDDNILTARRF